MKQFFTLIALVALSISAQASSTYYCQLKNVPAVKKALKQALTAVQAEQNQVKPTGEINQFTVSGMGDAFDFWGTDILVFKLDGLAKDVSQVVAVKVKYSSIYAKDASAENSGEENYVCKDTGERNAEIVYIDGQGESAIEAKAFKF